MSSPATTVNNDWFKTDERVKKLIKNCMELEASTSSNRMQIAQNTLEFCQIVHGGTQMYATTMKWFAENIGINYKTLSNWVYIKKNIWDKLSEEEKKSTTFTMMSRTYRSTRQTVGEVNPLTNRRKCSITKSDLKLQKNRIDDKLLDISFKLFNYSRNIDFNVKKLKRSGSNPTEQHKKLLLIAEALTKNAGRDIRKYLKKKGHVYE